jgi:hypothetical protein
MGGTMPTFLENFNDLSDSQKILTLSMGLNQALSMTSQHQEILVTGNGEPSIRDQVRSISETIKEWKSWIKWFIMLLITQAVAVFAAIIVGYIKFLPLLEQIANNQKP